MADGLMRAQQRIRAYIADHFPGAASLGDTESLLDSGIVDSIGVLELVAFIEEQFDVTVTDDDLLADHFESVGSLAALVLAKRGDEGEMSAA